MQHRCGSTYLRGEGEQADKLRDERVRMLLDHLETSFRPQILDSDDGTARELKIPAHHVNDHDVPMFRHNSPGNIGIMHEI